MVATALAARDRITALREQEFTRLDRSGVAYLDYTGAALYPESQIRRHAGDLMTRVLGNPHSDSGPSRASTAELNRARRRVLAFFRADPRQYEVIFTANATGAVHHVAASFPFTCDARLVLTADNHNSVNGVRAYAERRGADVAYVPLDRELRSCSPEAWLVPTPAPGLFAYPAQSNFSGVRHPLEWIELARRRGYRVLLDAASFVASCPLRLDEVQPDYVCLSCYKMFGYPTSAGVLLARRDALALLERPWFAGGTVDFVSVQNRMHRLRAGAERFEDGTPDFLGVAAVTAGFDFLDAIGMASISTHVNALTARLLAGIAQLNDVTGYERNMVYGPRDLARRGGTIAFNVVERDGKVLPYEKVEAAAAARGIALRGGCFCNPGAAEYAFDFPADRGRACLQREPFSHSELRACLDGGAVGAVRASVGLATCTRDVDRLLDLLRSL
jgi:selenocysteine lyase/cysteine desulfurase